MKVYIVTAGEYSDYHIERVFLSYEKAEQFVALQNRNSEWHSDDWYIEGKETFDDNLEGEIKVYYLYTYYYYDNEDRIRDKEPSIVGFQEREMKKFNSGYGTGYKFTITLKEKDDEKARKIAEDEFAKARALEF